MTAHHPQSPSKFPAWSKCPGFANDETRPSDAAERGTLQHTVLQRLLEGTDHNDVIDLLEPTELEGLVWILEWIKANTGDARVLEQKVYLTDADFETLYEGRADILEPRIDSVFVGDYKSGEIRDYTAQLAGYALAAMDEYGVDRADIAILYGRFKHVEQFGMTRVEAEKIVFAILEAQRAGCKPVYACDYCAWCKHAINCAALTERVFAVVRGREDWKLDTYHASQIAHPVEMSKALGLAGMMEDWVKSVKHHATEMAKGGMQIPGYKLTERAGRRDVTSVVDAFQRAAITSTAFLQCCSVKFGELEKAFKAEIMPDESLAAARRGLADRLGDTVVTGTPSVFLQKERAAKQTEEEI